MVRSRLFALLTATAALATAPVFFQAGRLQAEESTTRTAPPAPPWKLKDLDGHEVDAAQFKGKVVVLDFWATWCGPCVGEIPHYVELQQKYGKDGLVVIGALTHDPKTPAKIREFAARLGMNYTIVVSDDATEESFGGFDAIPTTFLIGRDGRIIHRKTGAMPAEEYEKLVKSALH